MKQIPLFKSFISARSVWKACLVLIKSNHGGYIGEGPEVKAFEQEFGKKFGFQNVAAVNSGSTALELAYELAGVGDGDEVIVPVLSHPATGLPAVHRRANIVFADIDRDLNVSVEDVRRKITPKTKAIVFVHFGGNNRGLKELVEIAAEKKIMLIEDAAQAVGSDFWGKGDFTCVSLQAIKTLTSGDGGFLVCKDVALHEKGKRLRWFGYDRGQKQKLGDTDLLEAGYKYHMNDITAAIGRGNLAAVDHLLTRRKALIERYNRHPRVRAHIWLATVTGVSIDSGVFEFLKQRGISAGQWHYRNDKYTIFGGRQPLPVMDEMENQYFLLPLHHGVSLGEVDYILKTLDGWITAHPEAA